MDLLTSSSKITSLLKLKMSECIFCYYSFKTSFFKEMELIQICFYVFNIYVF